jgi:N-acetyl-anhydromuramyl-L-alanine amidase AmpD
MRKLTKMIIHCSASDDAGADNIDTIRKWHILRGWDDVGYHFFIRKDGAIEKGRDVKIVGAHCKGHNHDSIGICLSGKAEFTPDQYIALGALMQVIQFEYGDLDIYPHNHFNKLKTCPNFTTKLFDKIV